ncbi:hypothetical protein Y702_16105 [Vibrio vulnificus BAA87]|nr:hypothetical protein Y702_16105 [Vibrio vulnificus BAA87]
MGLIYWLPSVRVKASVIKVKSLIREENDRKKYRGIAGGTIPRVSMTPSLAAGVTRHSHVTSGILERSASRCVHYKLIDLFSL